MNDIEEFIQEEQKNPAERTYTIKGHEGETNTATGHIAISGTFVAITSIEGEVYLLVPMESVRSVTSVPIIDDGKKTVQ